MFFFVCAYFYMKRFFALMLFLCFIVSVHAQFKVAVDTIYKKEKFSLASQVVPISLITAGGLVFLTDIREIIQGELGDMTKTKIDDYIQYVPDFASFGAHFIGWKHKNSLWNMTKYMALSQIGTCFVVQSFKRIIDFPRPYGGSYSFPSGHTSQAFVGATAQYNEFIDFKPWFAYLGYAFAATVGVLRVTNNRHWSSDVLAGAGIGMLITNLIYYYEPLKNWNPFEKKKYSVIPGLNFQGSTAVASLQISF